MSERNKRHEEAFKEAEQEWQLPRLYADLESVKQRDSSHNSRRKYLTPVEKCHLRGLLCFKTTKQIADARGRDEGTVKENISETLFNYIELLIKEKLNETFIRRWDCVSLYLEKAGYKKQLLEHPGARISETNLPSVAVTEQPQQNQTICPYLGLSAFREKDAAYFFGREKFTEELLKAVAEKPLIAVIGASGSGKSSVVFAGFIPRLRREKNWVIVSCRLGNRPFDSLSAALIPEMKLQISEIEQLSQVKKLAEKFRQEELGLQDVVELILQKNSDACRLLLVIDQFEELYALCQSAEERQRFLDELVIAVQVASHQRTANLTLVITLRADFYGYALSYRPFSDALQGAIANISSMSRQELKDAIEKPAAQASLQFEDGLTQRILKDVSKAPGNLPLLEFTLTQLWEKRRDGKLTHSIYQEIGGVEQALAKYAEEVYRKLNEDEQKRAKQIFIQLVRPGEGTADTRQLATRTQVRKDNWDLVTSLADARLVVSNRDEATGEETVEVVHEALIEGWQRLREWMESEREFRTWQERLRFRMAQWNVNAKDKGELLRGAPLVEAEKWLEEQRDHIPEDEQAFIQASRECQEQEEQRERELRRQAEISEIEALSSLSQALFPNNQLGALLAAVKAGRKLQETEAPADIKMQTVCRLWQALYKIRERNRFQGHDNSVYSVSFSPDGQMIASASRDCTVKLWRKDDTFVQTAPRKERGLVYSVSFSPDGKMITFASDHRTVELWHLDDNGIKTFRGHSDQVYSVSFSPDSQRIASASSDCTVKIWNLDGEVVRTLEGHSDSVKSVSFSPDGQTLASASGDGTVKLWCLSDGKEPQTLKGHSKSVNSLSFSPDGRTLASASTDGTVKLWSLSDGKEPQTFLGHSPDVGINSVSFSPDGKTLAWANSDGTVKLWSQDGTGVQTFQGDRNWINSVSFSPDGKTLASAGCDGMVKLWSLDSAGVQTFAKHSFRALSASFSSDNIDDGKELPTSRVTHHSSWVTNLSFSPNGEIIASASHDGIVKLWNLDGKEIQSFKTDCPWVNSVSFSRDGKTLAFASADGTVILWNLDLEDLLKRGCNWLQDYLKTNPNVSQSDRHLCDGIGTQK